MGNNYIDISTSNKNLKNKIKHDVDGPTDTIYWHIRFNIPLDYKSVNDDTMCVMDIKGNTLATLFKYSLEAKTIVISPLMPYKPNESYILTVLKEVRSENGNKLKEDIQVIFKLKGVEISDFTVLKGNQLMHTDVIERHRNSVKKRNSMGMSAERSFSSDRLYSAPMKINPIIGIIGIVILFIFIFANVVYGMIAGALLLVIGLVHIGLQFFSRKAKSVKVYNAGVKLYNSGNFQSAIFRFENALIIDSDNDFARYAISRARSIRGK